MALLNKLPGYQRYPPGRERTLLRHMPAAVRWGLLALLTPSILGYFIQGVAPARIVIRLEQIEFLALGLLLLFVNLVVAVSVGAFIIMIMKGPAYVADAYPLIDSDRPRVRGEQADVTVADIT